MTGTEIIFVVDDEAPIANTLAELLRIHRFTAVAFTDPVEALGAAQAIAPDLLVSDYLMPHMDGLSLARAVASLVPKCKVLIFTSALESLDGQPGCERFELLQKPAPARELVAKVRSLLSEPEVQSSVA